MRCDSNQRCEACPIESLPKASDRVLAGNVTRSVVRTLSSVEEGHQNIGTFRMVAEDRAAYLYAEELTATVVGAAAITLTGNCKPE